MDSFLLSIIIISATGVIGAFIKGKHKDRCFKYFQGCNSHILRLDNKDVWGIFNIESNAIEVIFTEPHTQNVESKEFNKTNFILYKSEFNSIKMLIHFVNTSDEVEATKRKKELNKLLNPNIFKRFGRRIIIFFNVVKDALLEVAGSVMTKSKLSEGNKEKLMGTFKDNSLNNYSGENHQPIWENYIGKHVILEQIIDKKKQEYIGVLKEYSAKYILLFNVNYTAEGKTKKADIIFPRINAVIRHAVQ
tara:strand:- start:498 stop:1241 length:744 start_codon:yes stop_codon:yes gene_type:complete